MNKPVPILVLEHHQPDTSWKRFVAVLCFLLFYVDFVSAGSLLWHAYEENAPPLDGSLVGFISDASIWQLLRAIVFYLFGRTLWLGRDRITRWLVICILISAAGIAVECTELLRARYSVYQGLALTMPALAPPMGRFAFCIGNMPGEIQWSALFLAGLIWNRSETLRASLPIQSWVVFAMAWVFGGVVELCLAPSDAIPLQYHLQKSGIGGPNTGVFVQGAALGCLGIGLGMGWRYIRVVALVLAAAEVAYAMLVMVAVKALFTYATNGTIEEVDAHLFWPDFFLLNEYAFRMLFVRLVSQAGPWLLIAIFAWKVPMRPLPDDGSPYPRRLCGQCHYNLQGLDLTTKDGTPRRCPECGAVLRTASIT